MLRSYDEHKETSIPWTNRVPKSWLIQRGKSIFQNKKQLNTQKQCDNILSLTLKGVVNNSIDNPIGLVPKDYATYQIFEKDDLVFKLIDLENYQTSRVGLVHELGIMSPAYIRIALRKKDDFNIKYFFYQYYDLYLRRVFNQIGAGVRSTLSAKELLNIEILIPPREEQDQIVRFLDWKLAKINKLIQAKKKQIALLNEQKQVIIHNAVTKGVDPNVMMKDSGIEWIGQIPQEWVVNRLKTQISLSTSKKNRDNEFYIGMENIQSWTGKYVSTTEIDSEGICNIFENNNILFGKLRPYLAKVYLTENNGVCSSEFLVLKNFNGILRYMFYILLSYKFIDLVNSSTYGAKMPRANWSFIGNCNIPIPSLEDQNRIASYLDEKCYKIENLKGKIQNEIDLLYEYRTRLISDVVTGKVDVRDIEIPEYEGYSDETINGEIDDNIVLEEEGGETEVE